MAEVILRGVGKVYPGDPPVRAVSDASLRVADGEFVVLVGPSGCGKSTLLRMVAGLEEVTEGDVRIGDRVVNRVHPRDRDVAMVFQDYALYPHMTVRRNMTLGLKLRKTPAAEIERRLQHAADLLGVRDLLDRKPAKLSGGQRQRVALGRAIVRQPACFLFDEPLSNLDARLRLHMRAELKALHQRLGTTTLYVTHDQEEAMTLGSRIVVLAEGLVQQIGTPLEVYRRPVNRFVAGFLGTPPMNFVDGRVEGGVFEGGGLRIPMAGEGAVTLGIRPEALLDSGRLGNSVPPRGPGELRSPSGDGTALELDVEVVEPLGDRMDVSLRTSEGLRLVARVPASEELTPGRRARFVVVPEQLHLFEPGEYGRRVT